MCGWNFFVAHELFLSLSLKHHSWHGICVVLHRVDCCAGFQQQGRRKMRRFMNITKRIIKDEEGAALVEYALLVSLIALACVTALTTLGTAIAALFTEIAGELGGS
jgi:pilus assembly protein Flp/PilA